MIHYIYSVNNNGNWTQDYYEDAEEMLNILIARDKNPKRHQVNVTAYDAETDEELWELDAGNKQADISVRFSMMKNFVPRNNGSFDRPW